MSEAAKSKRTSNFIIQGSILAAASIICRLIGVVYRVPLMNIVGEETMGVYSAAFTIYSIVLLISSLGIPTAVSRMVAAKAAVRKYKDSNRIFKGALLFALIVGTCAALVMYFGAGFFAEKALNMPTAKYAIRMLSPTVMVMAFLGVYRGYYQGLGTMIPSALSQIVEQIFNAVISIAAAYYLYAEGAKADRILNTDIYAVARGAEGATVGTGVGALVALILCMLIYLLYRRVLKRQMRRDKSRHVESYLSVWKTLVLILLPIIFNSAIYNISSLIDNSIFGHYTEFVGITQKEYQGIWGCYEGKYHLLTHVPISFATGLAASIVPALTRAVANQNHTQVANRINTSLRFTMLIAIPSCVGLAVLADPIVNLLFPGNEYNSLAVNLLWIGCITVVLYSWSTVTNAVLQGLNRMNVPARNAFIALVSHVVILAVCLWVFRLGIQGVVLADITFGLTMVVLNMISISRYVKYRQDMMKNYVLPLISSLIMGAFAFGVYTLLIKLVKRNWLATVISIIVVVIVYGVLLLLTKCVDEVDLYSMPKGKTVVNIAKKLHLLK